MNGITFGKHLAMWLGYIGLLIFSNLASAQKETAIVLTAEEFSFTPKIVTVATGTHVKLTLSNMGELAHNVTIEKIGVMTPTIQSDKLSILEFTAPTNTGNYSIICDVPGHKEAGMRATLKVE